MKITAHTLREFPVSLLWMLVTVSALCGKQFPQSVGRESVSGMAVLCEQRKWGLLLTRLLIKRFS